jgi:hypothetical protein
MLRQLLKRLYRSVPVVRELAQLRDLQYMFYTEILEIRAGLEDVGRQVRRLRDVEALNMYLAIHEHLAIREHPRYGDPRRLSLYEHPVCAQNGEDGMIREIFRRVGTTDSTFAEVGVGDGKENNTVFLLAQGWKGFWFDGTPLFLDALEKTREEDEGRLKSLVSMVTRENVASLFQRLGVPREFDLLSLDIDQNTYFIWEGLRDYRPRVVVVEYNASIPCDLDWKVKYVPDRTWDWTHNFGASLKAFENLGRELGYSLVGCDLTGTNAFFVRDDLVGDRFAEPFTSENHYEPPRYRYDSRHGHPVGILDRIRSNGSASDEPRPPRGACLQDVLPSHDSGRSSS